VRLVDREADVLTQEIGRVGLLHRSFLGPFAARQEEQVPALASLQRIPRRRERPATNERLQSLGSVG
jgi:hypothetical protein